MYNFPNEAGRPVSVASPSSVRGKLKRESGYYAESWSSSPLTRETLKRNAEEGNKREVIKRISFVLSSSLKRSQFLFSAGTLC